MAASHMISTTGPRGGRSIVEAALCLRVGDLRRPGFGWVGHDLVAEDGTAIRTRVEASDDRAAWLHVEHWRPGATWAASSYTVALVPTPQHLGGARWRFLCPDGFGRCSALYLPAGAARLASRQAHGLAFASQRRRAPARAAARGDRLRRDLGGADLSRPKGMWSSTFARRSALLASLDAVAAAHSEM